MHIITLLLHTSNILGSSNFSLYCCCSPVILMVHVVLMRLNRGSIYLHYLALIWLVGEHSSIDVVAKNKLTKFSEKIVRNCSLLFEDSTIDEFR